MLCKKCGEEIRDDAVVCVHCGCSVEAEKPVVKDKINILFVIISFLFPLFGFIYGIINGGKKPRCAKACLFAAIAGSAFAVVGMQV